MKKYILLFLTGLFISVNTFPQTVGITDFMRLNPYSGSNNPAYFMPYNGYVGIPGASNINFSLLNTSFIYKNFIKLNDDGTPEKFTPNKFVNSLHPTSNWFNTNLNMELLGFGFRVKKCFFSFNYRLKMDQQFRYSRDLFGFLLQGNLAQDKEGNYIYKSATLEIEPNITVYQEMSLGFQTQIFDWLYIGARPKILFGLANINPKLSATINTDPEDYTIFGTHNVDINVASIIPFYKKDADGNISLNSDALSDIGNDIPGLVKSCFSKNLGFAIDLGAVYRLNQQVRFSASVTDLGFIRWKGKGALLNIASNPNANSFKFEGFNEDQITNLINNGIDFNLDTIFNVVSNNFSLNELNSYSTMLTSKVMLDGYFDLTPSNRFILQFKGYIMGKNFLPQFTVAYNGSFFRVFDIVLSYSMMRNSFANLGVGLGIRIGPLHLYAGTDNILAAVNVLNATKINVTTGLLINFPVTAKVKEPELKSLFKKREGTEEAAPVAEKEPKVKEPKQPKEPKVKEPKQPKEKQAKETTGSAE